MTLQKFILYPVLFVSYSIEGMARLRQFAISSPLVFKSALADHHREFMGVGESFTDTILPSLSHEHPIGLVIKFLVVLYGINDCLLIRVIQVNVGHLALFLSWMVMATGIQFAGVTGFHLRLS